MGIMKVMLDLLCKKWYNKIKMSNAKGWYYGTLC